MFSYRHAFHAGNHADVLKHSILVAMLRYMTQKDTALSVVDTHAGAGLYRLDGDQARTSGEAASGIFSLVGERGLKAPGMGSLIDDYLAVLREFSDHPEEILRESCWVALHMYDREAFLSAGVCV